MSSKVHKGHGHWFLGHVYGHITTTGYFHCFVPCCPYSVKLKKANENDQCPTLVDSVVFDLHCHAFLDRSRVENRKMLKEELKVIESGQDVDDILADKHKDWQEQALQDCRDVKGDIIDKKATIDYACTHLHLTGRQVVQNSTGK